MVMLRQNRAVDLGLVNLGLVNLGLTVLASILPNTCRQET